MSRLRGFRSLLAAAVLTTGLAGCADLNGIFKLPTAGTISDGKDVVTPNPGDQLENPGDQLLSNGAATAITDVMATLRDVGALKAMASQQPLLSNSGSSLLSNAGSSLLSNGMSGFRIASTGMSQEDHNRIAWSDDGDWPDPSTLSDAPVSFTGEIKGTLDGVEVERYTYAVTMTASTYQREETVHLSSYREKGLYVVTGQSAFNPLNDQFADLVVTGTSTFDPSGVNRQLTYDFNMFVWYVNYPDLDAWNVDTRVKGTQPSGAEIDVTMAYAKDYVDDVSPDFLHTLSASGSFSVAGRTTGFKTTADLLNDQIQGSMDLGLSDDFWLSFGFQSNTPLVGSVRNKAGEILGPLTTTDDKKHVVITHPDDKKEHLDLSRLPKLYLFGLDAALPPI